MGFVESCDICNPMSIILKIIEDFSMEIQNAGTTLSKSHQLQNVNNVRWKCTNFTTQQGKLTIENSNKSSYLS